MREYRIYRIGGVSPMSAPVHIIDCADDQEALEKAQQLIDGYDLELWDDARLLCRLPAGR